jgi:hypothetical protein
MNAVWVIAFIFCLSRNRKPVLPNTTRDEINQPMGELARNYMKTHDKEIIKELYKLGRELEKLAKQS